MAHKTPKVSRAWENRATMGEVEAIKNDPKTAYLLDLGTIAWILGASERRTRENAKAGKIPGARLENKRWKFCAPIFFAWLDGELAV